MYEAIVLAGGLGTRLRSVVADLPKSMAPVAGKPFLAWQLEHLIHSGVDHFVLSLGYRAETICSYFGTDYQGAQITYSVEQEPLGTGGAIRLALEATKSDRVFVFNGDSLCAANLSALRARANSPGAIVMCVHLVQDASRYGLVQFDTGTGRVTKFGEKKGGGPGYINAGIYDLPKNLLSNCILPTPFSFETEVLKQHVGGDLFVQQAGKFFIDIGIPEDYARAQTDIPLWIQEDL